MELDIIKILQSSQYGILLLALGFAFYKLEQTRTFNEILLPRLKMIRKKMVSEEVQHVLLASSINIIIGKVTSRMLGIIIDNNIHDKKRQEVISLNLQIFVYETIGVEVSKLNSFINVDKTKLGYYLLIYDIKTVNNTVDEIMKVLINNVKLESGDYSYSDMISYLNILEEKMMNNYKKMINI